MTLRRWTAPLSAAVLVVAIVLLAVRLAGGDSTKATRSTVGPVILHLASSGTQMTAMSARSTTPEPTPPTATQPYKLTGTLPAGTPADQALWRLRDATTDDAQRVAGALHLRGTPTRVTGGWVLRAGSNRLVVRDDGGWSYGMDCSPDTPVADEEVNVGCAAAASGVAVSSSDPVPVPTYPPGPSDAEARSAAGAVFDGLGLGDPTIVVYSGDPMSTVQASPSVDGKQSVGWVTTVQINGSGDIVSADGWLTDPMRGADYPVISAQRAFDLLQLQPRPMMALCAQRPDGKPGCATIPPTEVTGATLGLTLDQDRTHEVLVPAWLFSVKGQDEPVAQVAVDPAWLGTP